MNREEILDKVKEVLDDLKRFPKEDEHYCFKCKKLQCKNFKHDAYWIDLKVVDDLLNQIDNIEDL